jgi:hypothetical protein
MESSSELRKRLGRRVLNRWNKELHGLVCGAKSGDQKDRDEILKALNLGEAAAGASRRTPSSRRL